MILIGTDRTATLSKLFQLGFLVNKKHLIFFCKTICLISCLSFSCVLDDLAGMEYRGACGRAVWETWDAISHLLLCSSEKVTELKGFS